MVSKKIIKVGEDFLLGYMDTVKQEVFLTGLDGRRLCTIYDVPIGKIFEYGQVGITDIIKSEIWFYFFLEKRIEPALKKHEHESSRKITHELLAKLMIHREITNAEGDYDND